MTFYTLGETQVSDINVSQLSSSSLQGFIEKILHAEFWVCSAQSHS